MPGPGKYGVSKALGKAASAGNAWAKRAGRRQPTKSELAAVETKRIDEQQRKARAEAKAARKSKKPKKPPATTINPFKRLTPEFGGPLGPDKKGKK